jgi:hypothetical protein
MDIFISIFITVLKPCQSFCYCIFIISKIEQVFLNLRQVKIKYLYSIYR